MKKTVIALILLAILCVANNAVIAENGAADIPSEVLEIAVGSVSTVISDVAGDFKGYGFSDINEVKQLELGEGFPIYYIDWEKLYESGKDSLLELINPEIRKAWLFTLDIGGKAKTFLMITNVNGKYSLAQYGDDARAYGEARDKFKEVTAKSGKDIEPVIIENDFTHYFIYKDGDQELVLPVTYDDTFVKTVEDIRELIPASEIIANLQKNHAADSTQEVIGNTGDPTEYIAPNQDASPGTWLYWILGTVVLVSAGIITIKYIAVKKRKTA